MWSRRRFLLVTASGMAVAGGALLAGQLQHYSLDEPSRNGLRVLSVKEFVILRAAARRILASDEQPAPSPDEIGVAGYIDRWLAGAPAQVRRDFGRLLRVVEHSTPLYAHRRRRFSDLDEHDQDAHLHALSESSLAVLREGFVALRSLCMLGYYSDPRTWPILGYDGPVVPRGWAGGEVSPP
jgi:hypothetical protein